MSARPSPWKRSNTRRPCLFRTDHFVFKTLPQTTDYGTMPLRHITGLNHSIFASEDLEAARRTFSELGFCLTPRGVHAERGTANYCIMFDTTNYIELLGVAMDAGSSEPLLVEMLKQYGEGIAAVSFDSDDAMALWKELQGHGFEVQKPHVGSRSLDVNGVEKAVRFEILRPPAVLTPTLRTFVCRHLDPDIVYATEFRAHSNSAKSIKSITLPIAKVHDVDESFRFIFGEPTAGDSQSVAFATGNCTLRFATADWIAHDLESNEGVARDPAKFVIELSVGDLDTATDRARSSGHSVTPLGAHRSLVSDSIRTCGVTIVYDATPPAP